MKKIIFFIFIFVLVGCSSSRKDSPSLENNELQPINSKLIKNKVTANIKVNKNVR